MEEEKRIAKEAMPQVSRSDNAQFNLSFMGRHRRESTNFDSYSRWQRYRLSVRYQTNSISRTISRLESESNFMRFNYKVFIAVLIDFIF
mmetsp:Transcript_1282/g.1556  ORF Transcript_1282/g.1556 Transcript_1282/m.1556 type:complete len:89 (+) Transcript_1282:2018-2284(+)